MEAREAEAIFQTILDVGVTMLKSGGEVYRVEDTICRLIRAYGGENPHVFAIPSHIVATAEMGGREMTSSRRLMAPCINLEMLDRVNDLARHVCRETPDAKTMRARLEAVEAAPTYTLWQKMFIYALGRVFVHALLWRKSGGRDCQRSDRRCDAVLRAAFSHAARKYAV